jgi:hypothetical protein
LPELVELVALVRADDEVLGGEPVAQGVVRHARLPFNGARSGGKLGVRVIGSNLGG